MDDSVNKLLSLAQKRFDKLTEAERRLLYAVARNEVANFQTGIEKLDRPIKAKNWGVDRILQADRIIWLLTDTEAIKFFGCLGLWIWGAKIEGEFDLEYAKVDVPIGFLACTFTASINLHQARLRSLYLSGTHVQDLQARQIQIEDSIHLNLGFVSKGEVNLEEAMIEGDLDCTGGKMINAKQRVLDATQAKISGYVYLTGEFVAKGEIYLLGVTIGGELYCSECLFLNQDGYALVADKANIAIRVFLSRHFRAKGEVRLVAATIEGDLDCTGGQFLSPNKKSLVVDRAKIAGTVFFGEGFKTEGEVRLSGATIEGDLDCTGGQFLNQNQIALCANNCKIAGTVFFGEGFKTEGEVRLSGATIEGSLDCTGGQFLNQNQIALCANDCKIAGTVFFGEGFKAEGEVRLSGVTIEGDLDCTGGQFLSQSGYALSARRANIGGDVFLCETFRAEGQVRLLGASIQGRLDCRNGMFSSSEPGKQEESKYAIDAEGTNIEESVYFVEKFQAIGRVSFVNARINNTLEIKDITQPNQMILDLSFAKVGTLSDSEQSWPIEGNLYLNGFIYNALHVNSPLDGRRRLKWLQLQPKQEYALQPYEQLAAVLEASGHQQTATEILISKENDRRRYGNLRWWDKIWNRFLGVTIAHGYHPEKALLYSLIFVVLGWKLFGAGYSAKLMVETGDKTKSYAAFNSFVYSIDTFIPVVDFHQESAWIPDPTKGKEVFLLFFKLRQGQLLRYYFWIQIITGWALTSLWIAGLTGLVRS